MGIPSTGSHMVTMRRDLQPAPSKWAEKLKKKPIIRKRREDIALGPGTTPWGRARLDALAKEVSGAQTGTRNQTLNKAAFLAGQAVAGGHITDEDAYAVLYDAGLSAGLTEREVAKTLRSGLRSGEKHPGGPKHKSAIISASSPPPAADDDDGDGDAEEKPTHLLVPGEPWAAIDAGSRWLASHPDVYSQQGRLVTVYTLDAELSVQSATAPSGLSLMADLGSARAWDCISQIGEYQKLRKDGRKYITAPVDPPMKIVVSILARNTWSGSRELVGITSAPPIHHDGTICQTRGYDKDSGMFFAKRGDVTMPSSPTQQDAIDAVSMLLDVVADFPWRSPEDRVGWLAALVTVATRHLYPTVPLFVFDASTPGSGKTLLTSVISTIALGGPPAVAPYTRDDEEVRKMTFALLLAAVPMVVIDNAPGGSAIGTPALDMLLTSPTKTDRVLGESRQATVRNNATWFYTGNNISIRGDTGRRTIHVRLETDEERPELRTGFRHPRLLEWTGEHRPTLVGATLTIVAAYLRAGKPPVGVTRIGSFEQWSEVVAGALVWAGQTDPCRLLAAASADVDPKVAAHIALLEALARYDRPMSARQILDQCDNDNELKCAIKDLCPQRGDVLPSTVTLGNRLRGIKDRIKSTVRGMRSLRAIPDRTKKLLYSVVEQSAGAAGASRGVSDRARKKSTFDSVHFNPSRLETPLQPSAAPAGSVMQDACQDKEVGGEKQQEIFPGVTREEIEW